MCWTVIRRIQDRLKMENGYGIYHVDNCDEEDFSELVSDMVKSIINDGDHQVEDEAADELAADMIYRVKCVLQDSQKFMEHGKRRKLLTSDVDNAMRIKSIEPAFGLSSSFLSLPLRLSSGSGRDLVLPGIPDDQIQDIVELTTPAIPKASVEPTYRAHWLAIEGMQPAVPENPPPYSKSDQREDSVDPALKLVVPKNSSKQSSVVYINKTLKTFNVENDVYKQLATYEPSVEQQLYYKEIIEACVGSDDEKRKEALSSLSTDPGLHDIVPRLTTFIAEGVRVNVVQRNLAVLIYLMRMIKSLLDNQSLNLDKYLHDIIPSIATCILSKQFSCRPDVDNHWALRDFAARLMAQVCRTFTSSSNNIQTRMTRLFCKALSKDADMSLSSVYGAIAGLGELGPEVVQAFILPKLKQIGERISALPASDKPHSEPKAGSQIKQLILKYAVPVLKESENLQDYLNRPQEFFGELGSLIALGIAQSKSQEANKPLDGQNNLVPPASSSPGLSRPFPVAVPFGSPKSSSQSALGSALLHEDKSEAYI